MEESKEQINLRTLKRIEPEVKEIVTSAGQVAIYKFSPQLNEWVRKEIEGSMFVIKRNTFPFHGFIVINRLNTNNMVQMITQNIDTKLSSPYLMFKNENGEIYCIWFYDNENCAKAYDKLHEALEYSKRVCLLDSNIIVNNNNSNNTNTGEITPTKGQQNTPGKDQEIFKRLFVDKTPHDSARKTLDNNTGRIIQDNNTGRIIQDNNTGRKVQDNRQTPKSGNKTPKTTILQKNDTSSNRKVLQLEPPQLVTPRGQDNKTSLFSTQSGGKQSISIDLQTLFNYQNNTEINNTPLFDDIGRHRVNSNANGNKDNDCIIIDNVKDKFHKIGASGGSGSGGGSVASSGGGSGGNSAGAGNSASSSTISTPIAIMQNPKKNQSSSILHSQAPLASQLPSSLIKRFPQTDVNVPPNSNISSSIGQPNPLTMEQLKQTLIYLLQNDADFLHAIHTAYVDAVKNRK